MPGIASRRRPLRPGGDQSSPTTEPPGAPPERDLARDTRDGKVGEVVATPDQVGLISTYWLRPVGGGYEWQVPRKYLQIIDRAEVAA